MLKFVGDINLTDWDFNPGFGIGSRIAKGFDPFVNLDRHLDDIWIGNFEGVASDTTIREGLSSRIFRIKPEFLRPLPQLNYYGFANNHAMQHGSEAYENTVKSLESFGSVVFGTRERKSVLLNHVGKSITLSGVCFRFDEFSENPLYWYCPEYKEIESELASLPHDAFKVLFVHWGNEYINRPSSAQKKFAHWLIDAGFDLIIGMHPHVLQGFEDYHGGRIYYSLGNFVFDMASEACRYGAVVELDLEGDRPEYSEEYVEIGPDCIPAPIAKENVPKEFTFEYLNQALKKEENSEEYHSQALSGYQLYRKENHKVIIKNMLRHPANGVDIMIDFIKRRL